MIKTITVVNSQSESVVLDLRSPEQSGFFVRGVDGLNPPKATINTSESLSIDGATFNSARLGFRNIVFNLGYLEKPTIEDSRQNSYKYFPLKGEIEIIVETDKKTTKTRGRVESNEINIFSKDEGSLVSVICPDPYFRSLQVTITDFSSIQSLFEFPFSNESLTEKLIIFGNILTEPQKNVNYVGDAPTGFRMRIHTHEPVGTVTIYNLGTRESMTIDSDILTALTGSGLISGDEVVISTIKGNKYVTLIRGGEEINILNSLGPDSVWFTLKRGDNVFYYTATYGEEHLHFIIEHETIYEGI